MVGRLPHDYDTWIGWGHTIPNGDPAEPIADTSFIGVVLGDPVGLPGGFATLNTKDGETIHFYGMIPLYRQEMDAKLQRGVEVVFSRLTEQGTGMLVDKGRRNTWPD